jgi:hypothetical protein
MQLKTLSKGQNCLLACAAIGIQQSIESAHRFLGIDVNAKVYKESKPRGVHIQEVQDYLAAHGFWLVTIENRYYLGFSESDYIELGSTERFRHYLNNNLALLLTKTHCVLHLPDNRIWDPLGRFLNPAYSQYHTGYLIIKK